MRKYIPTDKILSSVILIKPTPCRKVLQSGHRQSGFQDLFLFLKPKLPYQNSSSNFYFFFL